MKCTILARDIFYLRATEYRGSAKRQAGQVSRHLHVFEIFPRGKTSKTACWGVPSPNPATSCQLGPKLARCACCCVMSLSLHFLVFLRVRQAEQMIYIGFCCYDFLHFFFRGPVFPIGRFFVCRQLLILRFQRVHLGKFPSV